MEYFIGSLIGGIILCLFGFKLQKVLICLSWAAIGFLLGKAAFGTFAGETGALIAGLVVAILLGFIGFKLYKVGIFVLCFILSFMIIYNLFDNEVIRMIAALAGGGLIGFVALQFIKPALIIMTSFSAGSTIAEASLNYFHISTVIYWIILIIVAVIGIYFQFKTTENEEIKEG